MVETFLLVFSFHTVGKDCQAEEGTKIFSQRFTKMTRQNVEARLCRSLPL